MVLYLAVGTILQSKPLKGLAQNLTSFRSGPSPVSALPCESLSPYLLSVNLVQIVGLVKIDTQDFCFMDLSKIDTWFS